ncbi:hypothetical protein [Novosphingobium sediminicola]|uniref:Uncharacterized protein n=1 Tax=Novosphingobium sediminicola TaxID=563162 RepID=A0A7W6CLA4_9SPHN|nr:hypothetical protein [Novosphingobium sediminicola]MBB3955041.1 hypothetical protein [Novosphingobium sediminicola]
MATVESEGDEEGSTGTEDEESELIEGRFRHEQQEFFMGIAARASGRLRLA